jgi:hypothetical protein
MHDTPTWRFYQGLKDEWRWYCVDDRGEVLASADQAFAELEACMANAEAAGFQRHDFRVHARTEHDAHASTKPA